MPYVKKPVSEKICAHCMATYLPKINHPRYKYCSFACKEAGKRSTEEYKEKHREQSNRYNKVNQDKVRQKHLARYYTNKEYFFAKNVERRAKKNLAHPGWEEELTTLVLDEAVSLRAARKSATGIDWHLDHIIPLRGTDVCGLHVWNNFQVIPALENLRKGNKNSIHD